ncbi:MAG: DNA replication and repair protein RecF, partial [Oscillospiraceae bacterium]
MKVTKVKLESFRNLKNIEFSPAADLNLICGENGQGKTNILEAIWLFTGAKSFLGAREAQLLPFGEDFCRCSLSFHNSEREQTAFYQLGKKKHSELNEVNMGGISNLAGNFVSVIFSPDHLFIVKGAAEGRRRTLDLVITQLKPRYLKLLNQYNRILTQRNALLKQIQKGGAQENLLEEWDFSISEAGALISKTRESYCRRLFPKAEEFYRGISGEREKISFHFMPSACEKNFSREEFLKNLTEKRKIDIALGFTSIGAHRDDIKILIDGKDAADFASQGQQRSIVLSLKLAESDLIKEIMGEKPVILLD